MTKEELEKEWFALWNANNAIMHRHWNYDGPKSFTKRQKRNHWNKSRSIQMSLSRIRKYIDNLPSSE